MIHICTNDSLLAGGILLGKSTCVLCGFESEKVSGYVTTYCPVCKQHHAHDDWAGSIVRQLRNEMGYKRREFAEMLGVKYETLKRAEFVRCSKPIFNKTREIFHKHIGELQWLRH